MRRIVMAAVVMLGLAVSARTGYCQASTAQLDVANLTGMVCTPNPLAVTVAMLTAGSATTGNIIDCVVTTNMAFFNINGRDSRATQDGILKNGAVNINAAPANFTTTTHGGQFTAGSIIADRVLWLNVPGLVDGDHCTLGLTQVVDMATTAGSYTMNIQFTLLGHI